MKKVKNKAGFTLAELLITILILLMVTMIVAGGLPVAQRALYKVIDSANAQLLLSTTATRFRQEISMASDISIEDNKISYISGDYGLRATIQQNDDHSGFEIIYSSIDGIDASVPDEGIPLVAKAANTSKLSITYETIKYENGIVSIKNLKVTRANGSSALAQIDNLYIRPIKIPTPTPAPTPAQPAVP